MKFLLDTNIWSYIADSDSLPELLRAQRKKPAKKFLIAPGSINEALALTSPEIRRKIISVMTNKAWARLMPDTFLEAHEIKIALLSARPHWENLKKFDRAYQHFQFHFRRSRGGFWDMAREEVPRPVTVESLREERENDLARQEVRSIRDLFKNSSQKGAEDHLQNILIEEDSLFFEPTKIEYWRVATAYHFEEEMKVFTSPYRELLDRFIDVELVFSDIREFKQVWFEELSPIQLKRQWLRASMEYLQRWHKPTNGSPMDSLLTVHVLDADYFVTADRNFAKCLEKIHKEAPFKTAKPLFVPAGKEGVDEMLQYFEK